MRRPLPPVCVCGLLTAGAHVVFCAQARGRRTRRRATAPARRAPLSAAPPACACVDDTAVARTSVPRQCGAPRGFFPKHAPPPETNRPSKAAWLSPVDQGCMRACARPCCPFAPPWRPHTPACDDVRRRAPPTRPSVDAAM
ncbi:MAG: hypothetical protein J3K34DRAFT_400968 [Monoraphidium minutum]|nr:MAG: hypothetical protein J3K34DRAFT_400968 [Monoraphidium minutum]